MIVSIPVSFVRQDHRSEGRSTDQNSCHGFLGKSLEHKINYKFEGNAPEHIKDELYACAQMVSTLDAKMLSLNEEIQAIEKEQEQKSYKWVWYLAIPRLL